MSKQKERQNPEVKEKERMSKQKERQKPEVKEKERMSKQKERQKPEVKEKERMSKQKERQTPEFCERERQQSQAKRKNPFVLECERIAKRQKRLDNVTKNVERQQDKSRKLRKRKSDAFLEIESVSKRQKKYGTSFEQCVENFKSKIAEGPIYVCCCCHQTWFKDSVSKVQNLLQSEKHKELTLKCTRLTGTDISLEWICRTCSNSIKNGKVPTLSRLNKMDFPQKPPELDLHQLEERLIALRIPFMQIRELPRGVHISHHSFSVINFTEIISHVTVIRHISVIHV